MSYVMQWCLGLTLAGCLYVAAHVYFPEIFGPVGSLFLCGGQ